MINNAIIKAKELLNDNELKILSYAETNDSYYFEYGTQNNESIFDNCLIKVDKKSNIASYYLISQHLEEINNLKFKKIDIE